MGKFLRLTFPIFQGCEGGNKYNVITQYDSVPDVK
jgi:hypothetical protein